MRLEELGPHFDKKFFGLPDGRKGAANGTTDFEKGKVYWEQINATYEDVGFEPDQVKRVWVCWIIKGADGAGPIETQFYSKHLNRTFPIQILSLRDFVLPRLQDKIGTANYDDELLRVLGFVKQRELQTAMVPRPELRVSRRNAGPAGALGTVASACMRRIPSDVRKIKSVSSISRQ